MRYLFYVIGNRGEYKHNRPVSGLLPEVWGDGGARWHQ